MEFIEIEKKHSFSHVILNRPEKKNAFNKDMIQEITQAFKDLSADNATKVIVIKGAGDTFSAGADLEWMKSQIDNSYDQNVSESEELFEMFQTIKNCEKPVISYVHKYVMGGAIGLVAASDYCFAEENTKFCFSETTMGLAPSVISSFILSKCSLGLSTPLMMFAEFFDAQRAKEIGLVHQVAKPDELVEIFNRFLKHLEKLDFEAVNATKKVLRSQQLMNEENFKAQTTTLISQLRISDSAQERLRSFLNKDKS